MCSREPQVVAHDRCQIIRGGMEQYLTPMGPTKLHVNPIFEIGPVEPRFSEWLVFEVTHLVLIPNTPTQP